eukprot:g68716.t1
MNLQKENSQLKKKLEERDKKIKDLEKSIKDLQGEVNRVANASFDSIQHAFNTPGRGSLNRTDPSLLRMPHSHSQASSYMGSLTFASHMGIPSTFASQLSPQRSASSLPRARSFESGIPWENYLGGDTDDFGPPPSF